jgi:hypothetical protein
MRFECEKDRIIFLVPVVPRKTYVFIWLNPPSPDNVIFRSQPFESRKLAKTCYESDWINWTREPLRPTDKED